MLPAASARGIDVVMTDAASEAIVAADAQRLQQVVWNLLSNAIKFSPSGSRVEVSIAREAGDVAIRVSDDGKGIEPAFLPHIFERLRQADASTTRDQGGLGLGLFIARHLTMLHGGTLEASSDGPGHGSEFVVRLPAATPAESGHKDVAAQATT